MYATPGFLSLAPTVKKYKTVEFWLLKFLPLKVQKSRYFQKKGLRARF